MQSIVWGNKDSELIAVVLKTEGFEMSVINEKSARDLALLYGSRTRATVDYVAIFQQWITAFKSANRDQRRIDAVKKMLQLITSNSSQKSEFIDALENNDTGLDSTQRKLMIGILADIGTTESRGLQATLQKSKEERIAEERKKHDEEIKKRQEAIIAARVKLLNDVKIQIEAQQKSLGNLGQILSVDDIYNLVFFGNDNAQLLGYAREACQYNEEQKVTDAPNVLSILTHTFYLAIQEKLAQFAGSERGQTLLKQLSTTEIHNAIVTAVSNVKVTADVEQNPTPITYFRQNFLQRLTDEVTSLVQRKEEEQKENERVAKLMQTLANTALTLDTINSGIALLINQDDNQRTSLLDKYERLLKTLDFNSSQRGNLEFWMHFLSYLNSGGETAAKYLSELLHTINNSEQDQKTETNYLLLLICLSNSNHLQPEPTITSNFLTQVLLAAPNNKFFTLAQQWLLENNQLHLSHTQMQSLVLQLRKSFEINKRSRPTLELFGAVSEIKYDQCAAELNESKNPDIRYASTLLYAYSEIKSAAAINEWIEGLLRNQPEGYNFLKGLCSQEEGRAIFSSNNTRENAAALFKSIAAIEERLKQEQIKKEAEEKAKKEEEEKARKAAEEKALQEERKKEADDKSKIELNQRISQLLLQEVKRWHDELDANITIPNFFHLESIAKQLFDAKATYHLTDQQILEYATAFDWPTNVLDDSARNYVAKCILYETMSQLIDVLHQNPEYREEILKQLNIIKDYIALQSREFFQNRDLFSSDILFALRRCLESYHIAAIKGAIQNKAETLANEQKQVLAKIAIDNDLSRLLPTNLASLAIDYTSYVLALLPQVSNQIYLQNIEGQLSDAFKQLVALNLLRIVSDVLQRATNELSPAQLEKFKAQSANFANVVQQLAINNASQQQPLETFQKALEEHVANMRLAAMKAAAEEAQKKLDEEKKSAAIAETSHENHEQVIILTRDGPSYLSRVSDSPTGSLSSLPTGPHREERGNSDSKSPNNSTADTETKTLPGNVSGASMSDTKHESDTDSPTTSNEGTHVSEESPHSSRLSVKSGNKSLHDFTKEEYGRIISAAARLFPDPKDSYGSFFTVKHSSGWHYLVPGFIPLIIPGIFILLPFWKIFRTQEKVEADQQREQFIRLRLAEMQTISLSEKLNAAVIACAALQDQDIQTRFSSILSLLQDQTRHQATPNAYACLFYIRQLFNLTQAAIASNSNSPSNEIASTQNSRLILQQLKVLTAMLDELPQAAQAFSNKELESVYSWIPSYFIDPITVGAKQEIIASILQRRGANLPEMKDEKEATPNLNNSDSILQLTEINLRTLSIAELSQANRTLYAMQQTLHKTSGDHAVQIQQLETQRKIINRIFLEAPSPKLPLGILLEQKVFLQKLIATIDASSQATIEWLAAIKNKQAQIDDLIIANMIHLDSRKRGQSFHQALQSYDYAAPRDDFMRAFRPTTVATRHGLASSTPLFHIAPLMSEEEKQKNDEEVQRRAKAVAAAAVRERLINERLRKEEEAKNKLAAEIRETKDRENKDYAARPTMVVSVFEAERATVNSLLQILQGVRASLSMLSFTEKAAFDALIKALSENTDSQRTCGDIYRTLISANQDYAKIFAGSFLSNTDKQKLTENELKLSGSSQISVADLFTSRNFNYACHTPRTEAAYTLAVRTAEAREVENRRQIEANSASTTLTHIIVGEIIPQLIQAEIEQCHKQNKSTKECNARCKNLETLFRMIIEAGAKNRDLYSYCVISQETFTNSEFHQLFSKVESALQSYNKKHKVNYQADAYGFTPARLDHSMLWGEMLNIIQLHAAKYDTENERKNSTSKFHVVNRFLEYVERTDAQTGSFAVALQEGFRSIPRLKDGYTQELLEALSDTFEVAAASPHSDETFSELPSSSQAVERTLLSERSWGAT